MIIGNMTQDQIIAALRRRADRAREEWRKAVGVSTDVGELVRISTAWDEAVEIARGMGPRHEDAAERDGRHVHAGCPLDCEK